MATAKLINIEDAKLKTLSVEVKALTVNGKQMTLSTFRQLPEKDLFTDDYKLAGVPWGIVRYCWGDQDKSGFHVVWQRDRELFRSFMYQIGYLRDGFGRKERSWFGCGVRDSPEMTDFCIAAEIAKEAVRNYGNSPDREVRKRIEIAEAARYSAEKRVVERHNAEVQRLENTLPQLFIAV